MKKRGLFISFEGGEAVGKSTQIELLRDALLSQGFKVYVTREPGGTPLGEHLRDLIKKHPMCPRAELLLFEASRAELVESILKPRLHQGEIILCDRYQESSIVYQGVARKLSESFVRRANAIATGGLHSDMIVLLSGKKAKHRLRRRGNLDRIEREKESFHKRIHLGYRRLASKDKRFHVYCADSDRKSIHQLILRDVQNFIRKRNLRRD